VGMDILVGLLAGVVCGGLLRWCIQWGDDETAVTEQASFPQEESVAQPLLLRTAVETAVAAIQGYPSTRSAGTEAREEESLPVQETAPEEPAAVTSSAPEERKDDLRSEILRIIRSSPEGITLAAIAKQLQRHFASIIGPVRLLVEEGVVERQEKIYKIKN
jgi:hypothetical protein